MNVAELRTLLAAATPAPWCGYTGASAMVVVRDGAEIIDIRSGEPKTIRGESGVAQATCPADAALIVALRNNAEALLDVADAAHLVDCAQWRSSDERREAHMKLYTALEALRVVKLEGKERET